MKSIQTKIVLLIVIGISVTTFIVSVIGISVFKNALQDDAVVIMNLTCEEKAQELNTTLGRIEQSVQILSEYAENNLISCEKLATDSEYLEEYTKRIETLGLSIVKETGGAVAVYARFNPDVVGGNAGFFRVYNGESGVFESVEVTDIMQYERDDTEHVGWYYVPIAAGDAVWLQPYHNDNIDMYMISYVIPVYKDGNLFGVIGMDIDFSYITEKADMISLYDSGHAFLLNEDLEIVHSRHLEQGVSIHTLDNTLAEADASDMIASNAIYEYDLGKETHKVVIRALENGMYLAVTAPITEIDYIPTMLTDYIVAITAMILLIFIFVTVLIVRTIIKPLKELNAAAKEIAKGNLGVDIKCKAKDEVGTLAESFRETAVQLKSRIDYINNLAYIDKLTGVQNNTFYTQTVQELKQEIESKTAEFTVLLLDVNGLKYVNDKYGHLYGDELLKLAAKGIVSVFGFENTFRIGGDEFVVILKGKESEKCDRLIQAYKERLKKHNGEIKVCVAIGKSAFDSATDVTYESVFKRADAEMYKEKEREKNVGEISNIEQ